MVEDKFGDGASNGEDPGDDADGGVGADLGAGVVLDLVAAEGSVEESEAHGPGGEEQDGSHDTDDKDGFASAGRSLAGFGAEADERANEADEEDDDGDDLEGSIGSTNSAELGAARGVRVADAVDAVDEEAVRVDVDGGEGSGDGRNGDTDGDEKKSRDSEVLEFHCFVCS